MSHIQKKKPGITSTPENPAVNGRKLPFEEGARENKAADAKALKEAARNGTDISASLDIVEAGLFDSDQLVRMYSSVALVYALLNNRSAANARLVVNRTEDNGHPCKINAVWAYRFQEDVQYEQVTGHAKCGAAKIEGFLFVDLAILGTALSDKDKFVRGYAAWALKNAALHDEGFSGGTIIGLVKLLIDSDRNVSESAKLALAKAAQGKQDQRTAIINAIIELMRSADFQNAMLRNSVAYTSAMERIGVITEEMKAAEQKEAA